MGARSDSDTTNMMWGREEREKRAIQVAVASRRVYLVYDSPVAKYQEGKLTIR